MNPLTQEQAAIKWCPHARVAIVGIHGINRIDQSYRQWSEGKDKEFIARQEDNCKCIASQCSQWQWVMATQHGTGASYDLHGGLSWTRGGKAVSEPPPDARGYCGLAR